MEYPKWLETKLSQAFTGRECDDPGNPGWFVVWDDKANDALCRLFGVVTGEQPEYDIDNKFKVRFDWNLQLWKVSA